MRPVWGILLSGAVVFGASLDVVETTEQSVAVEVSLKDVNRIVCSAGDVEFTVYSKEKRVEVKRKGRNAFVKILPKVVEGELKYEDVPRELYVGCGGKTFSLILVPKDVPARTLYLKPPYADRKRAERFENSAPDYIKLVSILIGSIYRGDIPPGYSARYERKVIKFKELDLKLHAVYEGHRYVVEEYVVSAKEDIELHEGSFIPYIKSPLALALSKPRLRKGEDGRLIVLRLREE